MLQINAFLPCAVCGVPEALAIARWENRRIHRPRPFHQHPKKGRHAGAPATAQAETSAGSIPIPEGMSFLSFEYFYDCSGV